MTENNGAKMAEGQALSAKKEMKGINQRENLKVE